MHDFVPRFAIKNNGVLFENELLQIGVKAEYKGNLGKSTSLQSFRDTVEAS